MAEESCVNYLYGATLGSAIGFIFNSRAVAIKLVLNKTRGHMDGEQWQKDRLNFCKTTKIPFVSILSSYKKVKSLDF